VIQKFTFDTHSFSIYIERSSVVRWSPQGDIELAQLSIYLEPNSVVRWSPRGDIELA